MAQIFYRVIKNYLYTLVKTYIINIPIYGYEIEIETKDGLIIGKLQKNGTLTIFPGYSWDGASSIAINTKTNRRGSLIHDTLYQFIRMGLLPPELKEVADKIFYDILLQDGMGSVRAWAHYQAVKQFGKPAIQARVIEENCDIEEAP